jgi:hypothetical protein
MPLQALQVARTASLACSPLPQMCNMDEESPRRVDPAGLAPFNGHHQSRQHWIPCVELVLQHNRPSSEWLCVQMASNVIEGAGVPIQPSYDMWQLGMLLYRLGSQPWPYAADY